MIFEFYATAEQHYDYMRNLETNITIEFKYRQHS